MAAPRQDGTKRIGGNVVGLVETLADDANDVNHLPLDFFLEAAGRAARTSVPTIKRKLPCNPRKRILARPWSASAGSLTRGSGGLDSRRVGRRFLSRTIYVETLGKVVVLSVGGSLGVNARYWLGVWISGISSPRFPWATFLINVTGSFAIGFLTYLLARWLPHPNTRLFLLTGFLGGYTTFSTFEYDLLTLWERGEHRMAAANLLGSVGLGFAAVVLGSALARGITDPPRRAVDTVAPSGAAELEPRKAGDHDQRP